MTSPAPAPVAPWRPGRSSRRRARPASVLQRLVAWLVWPVVLGLPPLVLVLRLAFGLHGLLTLVHLLVGVPVMWLVGMVLAVLVTARACLVRPCAAGVWTTVFLPVHWLLLVVLALTVGEVEDTRGTTTPSALQWWGLSEQRTGEVGEFAVLGSCASALAAFVAAAVELGTARRTPPRVPPAPPTA